MLWISIKILLLLWAVNLSPPVLAFIFDLKWNLPLDLGRCFIDGKPLLGPHKTIRGFLGGITTAALLGILLGFPLWIGFLTGILSMLGDLVSSFIKRRLNQPSGKIVPGLDQLFEGLFPFIILGPFFSLGKYQTIFLFAAFSFGAYLGSLFLKEILLARPFEFHNRPLRTRTRFREWRACQMANHPLHAFVNFEHAIYYHFGMKTIFRLLGIYEKGKVNALEIQLCNLAFYFKDLPSAFENYTILFIADLHLDGLDGLTERLQEIVKGVPVDLCILGGDFRTELYGSFSKALSRIEHLVKEINAKDGIYAILGNHDCLEMIMPMQKQGVTFLVNDAEAVERDNEQIWIVGVDDSHYYHAHDLEKSFSTVPKGAFTIFASHSPDVYKEAAMYNSRLYLCGHTHAGQIQLPHIGPVFTHCKVPRRFCLGTWKYHGMSGYTSSGAGVSGIPVRFGCRGEVVHITLKRDQSIFEQRGDRKSGIQNLRLPVSPFHRNS